MKLKASIVITLLKGESFLVFPVLCVIILWCHHSIAMGLIFVEDTGKDTQLVQFRDELTKQNDDSQRQRKKEALGRLKSALQNQKATASNKDALQTINQIQKGMSESKIKQMPQDDGPRVPDSYSIMEHLAEVRAQKQWEKQDSPSYSEETQVFMEETKKSDILNLP